MYTLPHDQAYILQVILCMVLFMILEAIAALCLPYTSSLNDKKHTVDFYCENHTLLLEQLYYVACFINFFGIIINAPAYL